MRHIASVLTSISKCCMSNYHVGIQTTVCWRSAVHPRQEHWIKKPHFCNLFLPIQNKPKNELYRIFLEHPQMVKFDFFHIFFDQHEQLSCQNSDDGSLTQCILRNIRSKSPICFCQFRTHQRMNYTAHLENIHKWWSLISYQTNLTMSKFKVFS